MKRFFPLFAIAIVLSVLPASAAEQSPVQCQASAPLAEPWTSWNQSGTALAGSESAIAPRLILGKPVKATLRPADYVHYAVEPAKGGGRQGHGGLFVLALKVPSRVGIALSDAAWVDVVDGETALPSVDHGHGPDCSGIRKIVWFDLKKGRHLIQIANAPGADIRVMAADSTANQPRSKKREPGL